MKFIIHIDERKKVGKSFAKKIANTGCFRDLKKVVINELKRYNPTEKELNWVSFEVEGDE